MRRIVALARHPGDGSEHENQTSCNPAVSVGSGDYRWADDEETIMKQRSVTHGNFTIERIYPATPERVFGAFSDPAKKQRWFAEGEGFEMEEFEMDFRVGCSERVRFRSKDSPTFTNNTIYQDILSNRHIVFVYTMSVGDKRISSSMATVEFLPVEKGTNLILTEQGAFFEGADGPQMREDGWRQLLEQLAEELAH
jgi:uncharacterized protein YndB with AHSA1/START domain